MSLSKLFMFTDVKKKNKLFDDTYLKLKIYLSLVFPDHNLDAGQKQKD